jgi:hypothetical protein
MYLVQTHSSRFHTFNTAINVFHANGLLQYKQSNGAVFVWDVTGTPRLSPDNVHSSTSKFFYPNYTVFTLNCVWSDARSPLIRVRFSTTIPSRVQCEDSACAITVTATSVNTCLSSLPAVIYCHLVRVTKITGSSSDWIYITPWLQVLLMILKYSAIADLHTQKYTGPLVITQLKQRNYKSLTESHTPNIFFFGATTPIWALSYLHETLCFVSVF